MRPAVEEAGVGGFGSARFFSGHRMSSEITAGNILAEYAKRNVTANCVAPGFIVTPMTDKLNDKQRDVILAKVPANRAGTPEEVAAAVVFLASNEAAYVTGQTLHVNGGMVMI